jgi:hypothetical protein
MLVVQWWRSFAYPGSQAEGKRYHDWDGCIERITQLDSWPDVRTGSSTGMLRASISRPFLVVVSMSMIVTEEVDRKFTGRL